MSDSNSASNLTERVAVEAVPERQRRAPALKTIEGGGAPMSQPTDQPAIIPDSVTNQIRAWTEALSAKEAQLDARVLGLNRVAAMHEAANRILAIRAQLGLAMMFAFVLALLAMNWQSTAGLLVLIAWCALTVLPLGFLEWTGRRTPPR